MIAPAYRGQSNPFIQESRTGADDISTDDGRAATMNCTGIDHFVLTVEDVERTCAFYETLGAEVVTFGDDRKASRPRPSCSSDSLRRCRPCRSRSPTSHWHPPLG